MSTIPASQIVAVTPSVLAAGGSALDLVGVMLTNGTRVPIGTQPSFATAAAVSAYFGPAASETTFATIYFNGFDGSFVKPAALLITQYNTSPVSAFMRGGSVAALTLAQLQTVTGTLAIVIDGVLKSASINLAAATSFSNAATIIGTQLGITGVQTASFTGSIAGATMTVTALSSGTIGIGNLITGTGVAASTIIGTQLTGTSGGTGTYSVTPSQAAASQTITAFIPGVQFDSVSSSFVVNSGTTGPSSTMAFGSGAAATPLNLTLVTGAVLSQGAATATPAAFMNALTANTQNWASFFTIFDPDFGVGNAQKLLFAQWVNGTTSRYLYVAWDTDNSPKVTVPATASLGQLIITQTLSGTTVISGTDASFAAFISGSIASIQFTAINGRTTLAFRSQSGLTATVTDQTTLNNLIANGYNAYAAFGTANQTFVFFFNGSVSGPFKWLDSYTNQIWMNNGFQLALVQGLVALGSIPYNAAGNATIEQLLLPQINASLSFGAIRIGVTLSASQIAAVNAAAGKKIDTVLQNRGWYLSILPTTPQVRAARGTPPCTFFYMDGGSIQQINLASVQLQ